MRHSPSTAFGWPVLQSGGTTQRSLRRYHDLSRPTGIEHNSPKRRVRFFVHQETRVVGKQQQRLRWFQTGGSSPCRPHAGRCQVMPCPLLQFVVNRGDASHLFQQFTRGDPSHGDDVCPFSAILTTHPRHSILDFPYEKPDILPPPDSTAIGNALRHNFVGGIT